MSRQGNTVTKSVRNDAEMESNGVTSVRRRRNERQARAPMTRLDDLGGI